LNARTPAVASCAGPDLAGQLQPSRARVRRPAAAGAVGLGQATSEVAATTGVSGASASGPTAPTRPVAPMPTGAAMPPASDTDPRQTCVGRHQRPSAASSASGSSAFRVMPWTRESTSSMNAIGNSHRLSSRPSVATANTARPIAAVTSMAPRGDGCPVEHATEDGPDDGERRDGQQQVERDVAASLGRGHGPKNRVPARPTATRVSAAVEAAWVAARSRKPGPTGLEQRPDPPGQAEAATVGARARATAGTPPPVSAGTRVGGVGGVGSHDLDASDHGPSRRTPGGPPSGSGGDATAGAGCRSADARVAPVGSRGRTGRRGS
jgi:hypothetical protein